MQEYNKNYILNKNEMTVKFFKNSEWVINLQPYDSFLSPLYGTSSIVFKYKENDEKLNLERFLNSLDRTFESFYFFLSTFKKDQNGNTIACYKPNEEQFQRDIFEIEYREGEPLRDIKDFDSTIPDKIVSDKVKTKCLVDLTNQGAFYLKLIYFKDGFIISYYKNHSLIDHSSVFFFLKYLSTWYTYGHENGLKQPHLADSLKFLNEDVKFNSLEDAINYQIDNMGFGRYIEEREYQGDSINKYIKNNKTIQVIFNVNDLIKFKSINSISRNDIITSCILKILTFTPLLKDDEEFNLKFLCNFRKILNYDESAIGNFAMERSHKFKIKDIRSMSILELCLVNRDIILNNNEDYFKNSLSWLKFIQEKNKDYINFPDCLSVHDITISSWASFNYELIQFGKIKPNLLTTSKTNAEQGMVYITFEKDQKDNFNYTIHISVPEHSIPNIIEFGNSTNLFKVK